MTAEKKKKIKSLFSPRKLIVWLFVLILILTIPTINQPSMSKTHAIVTMMAVEQEDDMIKVATMVLTPAQDKQPNYQIYSGEGSTIGEAVDSISLALGKEMGFAQCEIMALGEKICADGVIKVLDYMTRTKKVQRNTILVNFSGELEDFAQAVMNLSLEKQLKLESIINFDKRYILADDSNIDKFYIGYYSPISLGLMTKIKIEAEQSYNSIEVSSASGQPAQPSSSSGDSGGESEKKYLVNDGTVSVFKRGKKYIDMTQDEVKKANYFINDAQKGTVVVENVSDHIYDNAQVVINIVKKDTKLTPRFEGDRPIYDIELSLTIIIDEVVEEGPNENLLRRNQDFFTDALVEKIKEQVGEDMYSIIDYCKTNDIDLLDVYKRFYALKNRQFEDYLSRVGIENYLNDIQYNITIDVKSEN